MDTAHAPVPEPSDGLVEQLRQYLSSITSTDLGPDDDYFTLGLVSSLRALEIVTYIEGSHDVVVEVEDLDLDNFRTAARVAEFIRRKRGEQVRATDGAAP
ncbi:MULTISPECIES: acyl carrier protein [Rhodococcus]|uniref:Phosphopantetheine-binding protein n=1 Tax=Rhodococcus oxybenzonivorans TaxID=1990687 RepID=A0AAE4V1Q3_9NOCA|nr:MULTISPECIES: phosphopantetheine-binding protein [Rhodococcus]MDV7240654.1 phosphopantetheine-binding protein [Rhodococcus oxybenzonivorans]MDV7267210.1 phosphopantetheine-binding protein [Rhodococcus oxybenzonivorans]MDV7272927.1 phosphopantetheine-binding protein [Rhodococcus oxybenzonivorans]MDV7333334.1 phosphopantetheine-binding protein [Rhodococcus oxybenzonivorans]MDV7342501.1 phosphopantetheine-binding protein [Rhodococcus oxybenzonivorans]